MNRSSSSTTTPPKKNRHQFREKREKQLEIENAKKFTISIPLKPQDKPVKLTKQFERTILDEYTAHYLEALGLPPSVSSLAAVRRHLPRDQLRIVASWKAQGWKADQVQVQPVVRAPRSTAWVASPEDILATTLRKEENVFHSLRGDLALLQQQQQSKTVNVSIHKDNDGMDATAGNGHDDSKVNDPTSVLDHHGERQRIFLFEHFNEAHAFMRPSRNIALGSADDTPKESNTTFTGRRKSAPANATTTSNGYGHDEKDGATTTARDALGEREQPLPLDELRAPLSATPTRIVDLQNDFMDAFPIKRFEQRYVTYMPSLHKILTCTQMVQLIALLCHLFYWTLFGRYSNDSLSSDDREQIVLALQKLHLEIDSQMRSHKSYTLFFHPVFLDSITSTVLNIFRYFYPTWFRSHLAAETDAQIISIIDRMFDSPYLAALPALSVGKSAKANAAAASMVGPSTLSASGVLAGAAPLATASTASRSAKLIDVFHSTSRLVRCVFPGADSHSTKGMRAHKMHIYETRFREEEAAREEAAARAEREEEERYRETQLRRADRSGLSALSPVTPLNNGTNNANAWKKATRAAAADNHPPVGGTGSGSRHSSSHGSGHAAMNGMMTSVPSTTSVRNNLQAASLAIQNEHDLSLSEGGRTHLYSLALRKVHDRHRHARTTASFFVDERRKQQKAHTAVAAAAASASNQSVGL